MMNFTYVDYEKACQTEGHYFAEISAAVFLILFPSKKREVIYVLIFVQSNYLLQLQEKQQQQQKTL